MYSLINACKMKGKGHVATYLTLRKAIEMSRDDSFVPVWLSPTESLISRGFSLN